MDATTMGMLGLQFPGLFQQNPYSHPQAAQHSLGAYNQGLQQAANLFNAGNCQQMAANSYAQHQSASDIHWQAYMQANAYRPHVSVSDITDAEFEPVIHRSRTSVIARMGFGGA